jgi:hypothetical protein
MIPVPENLADAAWTNVAPGAEITVSSSRIGATPKGLIDRRVKKATAEQIWSSNPSLPGRAQWIQLTFPVPIQVRGVRLYVPAAGGVPQSTLVIQDSIVRLLGDGSAERGSRRVGKLQPTGTDVAFEDVSARVVRIEFGDIEGTFYGDRVAALTEVEVFGRGQ